MAETGCYFGIRTTQVCRGAFEKALDVVGRSTDLIVSQIPFQNIVSERTVGCLGVLFGACLRVCARAMQGKESHTGNRS